ncbi:restriction endonuclease subunit S [uncultured Subdoligranulum sp.]|uniref:restriction endonuclease subunit S n=1 Tax=uncultured Subdoligranulum sp. TaxID=512298 RepID=UPI003207B747
MAKLGDYVNIRTGKLDANAASENGCYPFFTCAVSTLKIDTYSYDCECVLVAGNGDLNVKYYCGKFDAYQRTYIIESKDKSVLSVRYLYYFLDQYVETLRKESIGGVIKYIKLGNLTEASIPIPPLEEQRHIVSVLDKVTDLIAQRRAQLDKLDLLVKSRFVEMFGDPVSNPKGWPEENLQKNVQLLNGRAYKQEELLDSGKYPVLRVGNFFSNRNWYYSNLELEPDKYCDNGDLLYAWSASFGPQIWKGGKVIYHYHIWKVVIKDAYNKQFLCKLLEYVTASLMSETHGIAMMHLTKSGMEQTHFIVPPLELQEQFSLFVENVECIKSNIRRSLDKIVPLKSSLLFQYFKEA